MFRKHRRPFSYLHHLVVWQAMFPKPEELGLFLKKAKTLGGESIRKQVYPEPTNQVKLANTRRKWLRLLHVGKSLKKIRSKKLGARLYNWLYRYDNFWLQKHKPMAITVYKNTRVDWQARDKELVRRLIKIELNTQLDIGGPRRSKAWFAKQVGRKSLLEKKLDKLPLCNAFFFRYAEDIDEYQSRRLVRVCANLVRTCNFDRPQCEIEKEAGLNNKRIRVCSRLILEQDVPKWLRPIRDKVLKSL